MKKLSFALIVSILLIFPLVSAAYLMRPSVATINLDKLNVVKEIKEISFIKGDWGRGLNQFGIDRAGWLPGPMSLATDENDDLFILDQENKRVKKYSKTGQLTKTIPIDGLTYEDIAIDEGFIYLLDPVINHLVRKITTEGKIIRTYNIAKTIQPISGLYIIDDKIYVEVEHKKFYAVGSTTKTDNSSTQIKSVTEGHPEEDFNAEAKLNSKGDVEAKIEGRHPVDSIKIEGKSEVYSIISIESDKKDRLYIALDIAKDDKSYEQGKNKLLGLVVDASGDVSSKFYASNNYYTSHFRKIAVSPNGTIYQMQTTPEGVVVWKW